MIEERISKSKVIKKSASAQAKSACRAMGLDRFGLQKWIISLLMKDEEVRRYL